MFDSINTIIQSAPVPLLMINSQGVIVKINTLAENLFQYSADELIDKPIEILIPSRFHDAHIPKRNSFIAAPVSRAMESKLTLFGRRKNGEEFPIEVGLGAMRVKHEHLILATCSDLSSRKQAEALLIDAKIKSEAASAMKSEFLANMSHEIRTPMNAIIGLTQLTLDSELGTKQRDYLEKVFRSSKALLSILDDILDYSKIEAGKLNLEKVDFSLEEVVQNVSELFSAQIEKKGLELFIDIDPKIQYQLLGDPLRLSQVLNNFVGNAIKFTEQGEIVIKAEFINNDGNTISLRFSVRDTGIGMSAAQMEQLFSAFSQADSSITRKYGGTGLGLTISKRLVEMMGGEISLSSLPNKGSTFAFTANFEQGQFSQPDIHGVRARVVENQVTSLLNSQHPQSGSPISKTATHVDLYEFAAPIRGAKILLVEDNEINQEVTMAFLTKAGLVTTVARHGREAVELVQKEKFDAILMDIQMPIMDGLEATRLIRNLPQGKDLPIFALSAAVMTQEKQASQQAGVNEHIAKPFDPEQLVAVLLKWIKTCSASGLGPIPVVQNDKALPRKFDVHDLPGFDIPNALARLHGNKKILAKLLLRFAKDYASISSQVTALLLENNEDNALRLLHSFKGTCLILGAKSMAEATQKFEDEIVSGKVLESQINFTKCFDETVSVIQGHLSASILVGADAMGHKEAG